MLATGSFIAAAEIHRQQVMEDALRDRRHGPLVAARPRRAASWVWALPIALVMTIAVAIAVAGMEPATAVTIAASGP